MVTGGPPRDHHGENATCQNNANAAQHAPSLRKMSIKHGCKNIFIASLAFVLDQITPPFFGKRRGNLPPIRQLLPFRFFVNRKT